MHTHSFPVDRKAKGLASVLLERISKERAKLIKEKKTKKPKGAESAIFCGSGRGSH